MDRLDGLLAPDEREHRILGTAKAGGGSAEIAIDAVPERREQLPVELTAAGDVCDQQVDVVELQHGLSAPSCGSGVQLRRTALADGPRRTQGAVRRLPDCDRIALRHPSTSASSGASLILGELDDDAVGRRDVGVCEP